MSHSLLNLSMVTQPSMPPLLLGSKSFQFSKSTAVPSFHVKPESCVFW